MMTTINKRLKSFPFKSLLKVNTSQPSLTIHNESGETKVDSEEKACYKVMYRKQTFKKVNSYVIKYILNLFHI
jgi:hypothetical protein